MTEFKVEQYRQHLATIVRKQRRDKDLSQKALGELAGVSERTIIKIETGDYKGLTLTTVQAVTKALGVLAWMRLDATAGEGKL